MAKKKKKVVHKKSKQSFSFTVIAVAFSLFLVLAGIGYFVFTNHKVPCANDLSCEESLHLKIENSAVGTFNNEPVVPPPVALTDQDTHPNVLGSETTQGEKHIFVNLTTQTLEAYEGDKLFMKTLIASGKTNKTPTGTFTIWVKLKATRMTGGSGSTYYDLPNVPYVMFFSNNEVPAGAGYSLHGAYWHNNFGHAMSHGCVNMRIVDAEKLYYWVNPVTNGSITHSTKDNPGTQVTIFGEAPI
jgi:hypothetical protein